MPEATMVKITMKSILAARVSNNQHSTIHNSKTYLHLLYLILLVLLLRYWHFSYLKYKYCYEDLVYVSQKDANPDPPKPAHCPCRAAVASSSEK